ncbi:MAG TPA: twin-arginine translocase TatA/TatE family subunit [Parvibaculum sp.]
MGLSWVHILLLVGVIVLLFGRGKVSDLMGDVAKGIKSFKKGLADDDDEPVRKPDPRVIEGSASQDAAHAKDKTTANG